MITIYDTGQIPTFELCADACATTAGCVAFDWIDPVVYGENAENCFLLSSMDKGINTSYDSAILVGYTGP
jgi:hypothetical protein